MSNNSLGFLVNKNLCFFLKSSPSDYRTTKSIKTSSSSTTSFYSPDFPLKFPKSVRCFHNGEVPLNLNGNQGVDLYQCTGEISSTGRYVEVTNNECGQVYLNVAIIINNEVQDWTTIDPQATRYLSIKRPGIFTVRISAKSGSKTGCAFMVKYE